MESSPQTKPNVREVRYEATRTFAQILDHLGASLLVSTYQAGKLLRLGTHQRELTIGFLDFEQAMGVAVAPDCIAIGTRRQIHFLAPSRNIGPRVEPVGTYDHCWSIRSSFYTSAIHAHDLAWGRDGLWGVNTLFSTLCTLHEDYSYVPRWRPKFVTQLIDQDRCHLNGLAMNAGQPKYVTVLAESNEPAGWRPTKATSGCIIDVDTDEIVARNLSMPHSPRMRGDELWVLNSGHGALAKVDRHSGAIEHVEMMPGYTRGLAFAGQFAFVGLSKIRETNVFGGLPISEKRDELRCGVGVVDLNSGRTVATFQFHSGVDEIFAVEVLPGTRNPALFGIHGDQEQDEREVWIVPEPGQALKLESSTPPPWRRPTGWQD